MPLANILVPVDGSPVGEAALPYAEALASRTGATITLVRVEHEPSLPPVAGSPPSQTVGEAEGYLAGMASGLTARGLRVETRAPHGSPPNAIREEIAAGHPDLVVMATHDRTGPSRWARGSVAEAVVSDASLPVLLVRASQNQRGAERFRQSRPVLVVPLDGSPFAEAALTVAAELAEAVRGMVALVRVVPAASHLVGDNTGYANLLERSLDAATGVEENPQQAEGEARAYLAALAKRLGKGLVLCTAVRLGEVADQIAFETEQRDAAAVVMATHGRTGLARTLLGSVAGKVVHEGDAPVVLVRPRHQAAGGSSLIVG
jgi:nucleotide-binding universal stress UspA family protein